MKLFKNKTNQYITDIIIVLLIFIFILGAFIYLVNTLNIYENLNIKAGTLNKLAMVDMDVKEVELNIVSTDYILSRHGFNPNSKAMIPVYYPPKYLVELDYNGVLTITKDNKEIYDYCTKLGFDRKVKGEILIKTYKNKKKDVQLNYLIYK